MSTRKYAYRYERFVVDKWVPYGFPTSTPTSCYPSGATGCGDILRIAVRNVEDTNDTWKEYKRETT